MIKTYLLSVTLLIFIFGCAQKKTTLLPADASVNCVAKWQKNDSIRLKITRETRYSESNSDESAYYYATIKVLDTLRNGYLLAWQNIPPMALGNDNLQSRMANLFLELRIVYTTTKSGSFNSIENFDDMQEVVEATIREILNSRKDSSERATMERQMEQFRNMFSSKETVNQLMARDIQLFHAPYGGTFNARPDTIQTETAIPIGNMEPLPAMLIASLKELDNKNNTAIFSTIQQIDPAGAAKAMNDFLTDQYRLVGHEPKPGETMTKYAMTDSSTYSYQLSTGWINRLHSSRTADIENGNGQKMKQSQTARIETR
jgi:hypothetical protein